MKKTKILLSIFFALIAVNLCKTKTVALSVGNISKGAEIVYSNGFNLQTCTSGTAFYNPRSGVSDCKGKLTFKWAKLPEYNRIDRYSYFVRAKDGNYSADRNTNYAGSYATDVVQFLPGEAYVIAAAQKNQGNQNYDYDTYKASINIWLLPDSTEPTCSISTSAKSKWYKSGDTLYISCKDAYDYGSPGSGCWDSTNKLVVVGKDVTITNTTKLSTSVLPAVVTFRDRMGNEKTCGSEINIKIDNEKPTCSVYVENENVWKTSKKVIWSCKDGNGSGCTDASSGSYTATKNYSASSPLTQSECKDKAGNVGTKKSTAVKMIDTKAPTCNNPTLPTDYIRTAFDVTATCTDNGSDAERSGCAKTNYVYTVTSDKQNKITVKDIAGRTNDCIFTFDKFDATAPTVTITLEDAYKNNSTNKQAHSDKVLVNIKATDNKSGVNKLCYTLSGATTQSETCVNASETTVAISKTGNTTVTAYAFDNAKDMDEDGNITYSGGNRSTDAIQNVYIDNVKPTITSVTKPTSNWQKAAYSVVIKATDADSGVGTIETYWSLSNDIAKTFGAANKDKVDGETLPMQNTGGSKVYLTPNGTTEKEQTATATSETTLALSGKMYLHIRVCDRAVGPNDVAKPNCTTGVYGPYLYDGNADSDISVSAGSSDWTNKLSFTITAQDESRSGKDGSGIDKIQVYFNIDTPYMNTTIGNAQYAGTPTVANNSCNDATTCTFTLDFEGLKSNPVASGEPLEVTDGVRFIKVVVVDGVGNISEAKYFGPYKWDTTSPRPTNDPTFNGISNGTYMPYNY